MHRRMRTTLTNQITRRLRRGVAMLCVCGVAGSGFAQQSSGADGGGADTAAALDDSTAGEVEIEIEQGGSGAGDVEIVV